MKAPRVLVALLTLLAVMSGMLAPQASARQTTTFPGVIGSTYTSPQFGYSFNWDASWTAADGATEIGHDYLELDNGVSNLFVDGYATADDLATCLSTKVSGLQTTTGVTNFAAAQGQDGVLAGGDETQAWAVYDFTFTSDGAAADYSVLYQCFTVQAGVSQVVFTDYIPAAQYNDQVAAYQAIATTLVAPSTATTTTQPQPTLATTNAVPTTGISGNSYNNSQFGFSLSWDAAWTSSDETSESGHDGFKLNNGTSELWIDAYATGNDLAACLQKEVGFFETNQNVTQFVQATGDSGQPLGGTDATQSFGVYDFTLATDSGPAAYSVFIKCQTIQPGVSQLVASQLVPSDAYNDQIAPRKAVLDTLVITTAATSATTTAPAQPTQNPFEPGPTVAPTTAPPAQPTPGVLVPEPTAEAPVIGGGVSGSSYTSPQFGYSLAWDSTWTAVDESTEQGIDRLELDNGKSTMFIEGFTTTDDLQDCLATQQKLLTNTTGVSNVTVATSQGEPMTGVSETDSYVVLDFGYTLSDGQTANLSEFVECITLQPGVSQLVITQIVGSDAYNDEIAPREALIASIVLPGAGVAAPTPAAVADPASTSDLESFMLLTASDVNEFWTTEYANLIPGGVYKAPADIVIYDESQVGKSSPCGTFTEDDLYNAFYCPNDSTVYLSLLYAQQEWDNMDVLFPVSATIAHEWGHHIQNLMGLESCDISPCLDPTQATSQEIEVMADCFLGAWTRDAESRQLLGNFDVESTIITQATIGDASEAGNPGAHGDGPLRTYWFLAGYYFGAPRCLEASRATSEEAVEGGGSDTTTTTTTITPGAIGAPYQVGSLSLTVTGSEEAASLPGTAGALDLRAQGKFVIVYFSALSSGTEPLTLDYGTYLLTDSLQQGFLYDPAATNALLTTALPEGTATQLQPGVAYNLAVVFDVPADASGFTIQGTDGSNPVPLGS